MTGFNFDDEGATDTRPAAAAQIVPGENWARGKSDDIHTKLTPTWVNIVKANLANLVTGLGGSPLDGDDQLLNAIKGAILPHSKFDADGPPTTSDDGADSSGRGVFKVRSKWYDQVAKEVYECLDSSTGGAVWAKTSLTSDELGSAAFVDIGESAGNVIVLDESGRLPAIDASQLTGLGAGGDVLSTNNLTDLADIPTARTNLGLEIGVDVQGVGVISQETLFLYMKVAELEGEALGFPNGITDTFDDETSVDAADSLNEIYNGSGFYFEPSRTLDDLVPAMTSGTTGGVTVTGNSSYNGTNLPFRSFDDINPASSGSSTMWHSAACGGVGFLAVNFGSGTSANRYTLTAGAGVNNAAAPSAFTFEGSDDGSTWTVLDTQSGLTWTSLEKKVFDLAANHTYQNFRFNVSSVMGAGTYIVIGEAEIIDVVVSDMTLISEPFVAETIPPTCRGVVFASCEGAFSLNTQLVISASRDDGALWESGALSEVFTLPDGSVMYSSDNIDLSGQASDTSMRYKIETDDGKDIKITAAQLLWSD